MLIDGFGRKHDYLRVSVTERCNFRCQYCMPQKPFSWVPKENLLSYEDMFKFIKVGIDEGIKKVRITGGEPLIRDNLDYFIKLISDYKKDIDLALTTNAYLLPQMAQKLKDAGLKRINISLDTLNKDRAEKIAQKDVLGTVLEGIEKAKEVGLKIKINCVPLKGINDIDIIDILEFGKKNSFPVRYIEFMENSFAKTSVKGLNSNEILEIISKKYKNIEKVPRDTSSPAQYYKLEDGYEFGIIEPHKDDFCSSCNRIRLTAEGFLIPCLYFEDAMSIKDAIRANDVEKAAEILKKVLQNKPEKNRWSSKSDNEVSKRAFYETGG
ncbi:GTP 3',8-cyclase MoaA [Arcobacter porcinus]|uniref:GTP 3',8-cyclase n=1 Tax=Arcobacter porcinus TaxID=1935204 RepID=A0A1C0AYI0_9BACT|nr:GTP 3',8-cyclase MoaA [Arcobacter porcinus]OCL94326.1 Cyclic pyranopterin monophosphate synthase [Aliarcobacter thereius]OCL81539.1 Cyclic pyranopterin monophosphate synthase [Arcobacter porcinus]OCL83488.1 Cyclic pyranopterin monophosphate synthase [Arcobacter porcinus]OCL88014.1 Cyclic pyranopterin monophosphate synthase [Arcobacter porcinus]OCL92701.1 Cyclic pyranopterin monophosphate synthase [Arcobacter porcinus]